MYKWGLLDGNFFLRRNFSAAKFAGTILSKGHAGLIYSFLSTIFNYQTKFELERILIAWDKTPYKKLETIKEYKQNRIYHNQEEVEKLKDLEAHAQTEDERKKIETVRKQVEFDADCEKVFAHAKNSIIKYFNGSRLDNIRLQGYEADDIAYLFAKLVHQDGSGRGLMISVDSDWMTFCNPSVDYFKEAMNRKKREGSMITYSKEIEDSLPCPLYEYGNLKEIFTGGHNNVSGYAFKDKYTMEQFMTAIYHQDKTLPDYDQNRAYFEALNINNYDNTEINSLIRSKMDFNAFNDKDVVEYLRSIQAFGIIKRYNEFKYKSQNGSKVGGFIL